MTEPAVPSLCEPSGHNADDPLPFPGARLACPGVADRSACVAARPIVPAGPWYPLRNALSAVLPDVAPENHTPSTRRTRDGRNRESSLTNTVAPAPRPGRLPEWVRRDDPGGDERARVPSDQRRSPSAAAMIRAASRSCAPGQLPRPAARSRSGADRARTSALSPWVSRANPAVGATARRGARRAFRSAASRPASRAARADPRAAEGPISRPRSGPRPTTRPPPTRHPRLPRRRRILPARYVSRRHLQPRGRHQAPASRRATLPCRRQARLLPQLPRRGQVRRGRFRRKRCPRSPSRSPSAPPPCPHRHDPASARSRITMRDGGRSEGAAAQEVAPHRHPSRHRERGRRNPPGRTRPWGRTTSRLFRARPARLFRARHVSAALRFGLSRGTWTRAQPLLPPPTRGMPVRGCVARQPRAEHAACQGVAFDPTSIRNDRWFTPSFRA